MLLSGLQNYAQKYEIHRFPIQFFLVWKFKYFQTGFFNKTSEVILLKQSFFR